MKNREVRLAEEIKQIVSDIIQFEMKSKVELFSITYVKLNKDLSYAKIYLSFFSKNNGSNLAKIEEAKGFIRSQLAKKVRMRKVPELEFVLDSSIEEGTRILEKIKELNIS